VTDPLTVAVTVTALLVVAWTGVLTALDRRAGRAVTVAVLALEALLVVQLVVGIVQLAGTGRDVAGVTFVGYLIGITLVPPAGLAWSRAEPSRWGTGVLVVAGLVVAVLIARLQQIWGGAG
jgi:hypothetical protein